MWVGGWSRGGHDDTPPSDDVVPPLAQFHLVSGGTGPLGFRSGRLACGDALSGAIQRLLCKGFTRLLPIYTATVFRCVVSPAAKAMRLLTRGNASAGGMGASTSDAPLCVSAVRCV